MYLDSIRHCDNKKFEAVFIDDGGELCPRVVLKAGQLLSYSQFCAKVLEATGQVWGLHSVEYEHRNVGRGRVWKGFIKQMLAGGPKAEQAKAGQV